MTRSESKFAILGAEPAFRNPRPVGQLYFPTWDRYEKAMKGIFERRYYTNQGPLARRLEEQLEEFLGVKHAICVTNATIGLIMAAEALELSGKVILPSFTFIASPLSLTWTNIEPVFCDVDPISHHIVTSELDLVLDEAVTAIMGINLWGGACDTSELQRYADQHNLSLYFDSAHAFGCEIGNTKVANFGILEVFSFHATKVLNATEGGCICTNDDTIAARLRNIRSSYGAGKTIDVVKTANGRMSEAQAAIALLSLEDFPQNQQNNELLFLQYKRLLAEIPGVRFVEPQGVSFSNFQSVICEIDASRFGLNRDRLLKVLQAENIIARRYFFPGSHRQIGYIIGSNDRAGFLPGTDYLCSSSMQLPIGALVSSQDVHKICEIIAECQKHSHIVSA